MTAPNPNATNPRAVYVSDRAYRDNLAEEDWLIVVVGAAIAACEALEGMPHAVETKGLDFCLASDARWLRYHLELAQGWLNGYMVNPPPDLAAQVAQRVHPRPEPNHAEERALLRVLGLLCKACDAVWDAHDVTEPGGKECACDLCTDIWGLMQDAKTHRDLIDTQIPVRLTMQIEAEESGEDATPEGEATDDVIVAIAQPPAPNRAPSRKRNYWESA